MRIPFLIFFSFFLISGVAAQDSNLRCVWIKDFNKKFQIDTLSIAPGSIRFNVDTNRVQWQYSFKNNEIEVVNKSNLDSVEVCYRVFPVNFSKQVYNRSLQVYDSNALFKDPGMDYEKYLTEKEELFETPGLNKNGSISRSISFGNNQDVFVNSTLNLNLDGKITDDLFIKASITDQNIPFQPEGNTQQLQEFDNVFIQLYNDNLSLTGGDIILKNKPGYFLHYYKNVQGGLFQTEYEVGKSKITNSVGVSVAKGQFASIKLKVQEGILGPYKIPGPNNQKFLIILANSEQVFLDGKLLERGYNRDYIIDYNLGEITFTNNVLITKFSRVRIDYEFSDKEYNRSVIALNHYQEIAGLNLFINYYSEKDNKNKPLLFGLSNDEKKILSETGDTEPGALVPGADSVEFTENRILYKKTDTVDLDDNRQTIFIYSAEKDSAFYDVTFTDVGAGNGDYIQLQSTLNGKVFQWVSPVNGMSQGQFAPVEVLPAPNKKQLLSGGISYNFNEYDQVYSEIAVSDHDQNLFSPLDDADNQGIAFKGGIQTKGREFFAGYKLKGKTEFEFDDKNFNPIDRFRYIEFDRDWSFNPAEQQELFDDHIFSFNAGLEKDHLNQINYQLVRRKRGNVIDGYQHQSDITKQLGKFRFQGKWFHLDNSMLETNSEWRRLSTDLSFHTRVVVPGYNYSFDRNKIITTTDSVVSSAMNYTAHKFYVKTPDSTKTNVEINYEYREDNAPMEGDLVLNNQSNTANLIAISPLGENHKINFTATYRVLKNINNTDQDTEEETLSGRMGWSGRFLDNHIRTELNYAVSNAREIKREFVFIQVPTGEGTHTWRDLNGDGVQEFGEFFEAINPDERNYAKIFVPTNAFISAFDNFLNYRLNISMPGTWRESEGFKSFISRISNSTSWTVNHKVTDRAISSRLYPFFKDIPEDDLISSKELFRSTFFFNRASPVFGLNAGILLSDRKQLLTNGFEAKKREEYNFLFRINFAKIYNFKVESSTQSITSGSDFLDDRNFKVRSYRFSPVVSWQPNNYFRLSGSYVFQDRSGFSDETAGEQSALYNEFITEVRFSKLSVSNLNANVRYTNIDFAGIENSPLGYELLRALQPGQNVTWLINYQRKITTGLQLVIAYEGRKSGGLDVIHIGRAQVRALF